MNAAGLVRDTRLARKLTLAKFGEAIGVTRQAVNHWESGRTNPDVAFLLLTAAKFSDWRRDWALDCLHTIRPDTFAPVNIPEQQPVPCEE